DRAIEETARLEAVQRSERHHLRQVAGDPEHNEHVALGLVRGGGARGRAGRSCRRHRLLLSRGFEVLPMTNLSAWGRLFQGAPRWTGWAFTPSPVRLTRRSANPGYRIATISA